MIQERLRDTHNAPFILAFGLLFSFFSLFFNLGGRTLENKDYFTFAEVARGILETNDWIMMHKEGEIYVDKPPLHTWNIALAYRLFGLNPMAARLPSAVFGLLGIWAVLFFGMGIEKDNWKIGIFAALFLLSSWDWAYYSRTTRNDIEYAVLFSLCLISFYMGYETTRPRYKLFSYLFFWIFMGCAFLTKGPIAFLALAVIAVYTLIRKGRGNVGAKILFGTSPALLATILPWIILLMLHPDFDRYMTLLKTTTILTRRAGFFYYFPELFKRFFPASVFLLVSVHVLWRSRGVFRENPKMSFCLTWAGVYFLALHLTVGKNNRYLLPVLPPISIITAWGTHRMLKEFASKHGPFRHRKVLTVLMMGLVCLVLPVGIWVYGGWSWRLLFFSLVGISAFFFLLNTAKDTVVLICTFCTLSILSVDLGRTADNYRVSDEERLYLALQKEDIRADDIMIYRADPRLLSFYFNKSVLREASSKLSIQKGVKVVITSEAGVDEVTKVYGPPTKTRLIRRHRGGHEKDFYVIFVSAENLSNINT